MYSIIATKNESADVLVILEHQSLEYCTSVALDLFNKSSLNFRIVDESSNHSMVFFTR